LKSHAGDTVRVDRINRPPDYIPNATLTLGLSPQTEVLRGLMEKPGLRGRGALGRILYSLPASNLGFRATDAPAISPAVENAYRTEILALLHMEPAVDPDGNPTPHVLKFAPDALALFSEYRAQVEITLRPDGELGTMTDWGGKLCGAVARMA